MAARKLLLVLLLGLSALCVEGAPHPTLNIIGYFWQLTDVHFDSNYSVHGDPAQMCHLARGGNSSGDDGTPGEYGDYLCDAPWTLVEQAMQGMKKIYPDPDFILWTGDSVPHVSDSDLDPTKVFRIIANVTDALVSEFPNVTVYPLLGNHDAYPQSQMPGGGDYYQKILTTAGWDALLSREQQEQFAKGGYYSVKLGKGTRLLCLNTNLYSAMDKATLDDWDPEGQLTWLRQQLELAKSSGDKVHIAGHIPPGGFERSPGLFWFSERFNSIYLKLIGSYDDIIMSHFYGHEHTDSFRVLYSKKGDPKVAMFLSPAVTPWKSSLPGVGANNPGLRLFMYRRDTGEVLDYFQYFLNLTAANEEPKPSWRLEYQATKAYHLEDIRASSLDALARNFHEPGYETFQHYLTFNSVSYGSDSTSSCNTTCQRNHYCSITRLAYDDYQACMSEGRQTTPLPPTSPHPTHHPTSPPSTTPSHHRHHPAPVPQYMFYVLGGLSSVIVVLAVVISCLCLRRHRGAVAFKYNRFSGPVNG